ncbi:MAG: uracil-DNA glycosylase [Deltaproteobacteria bacterium]|nr:MAG: uracil-DNA glycosylase [Deltaproteobacteria bacterium]
MTSDSLPVRDEAVQELLGLVRRCKSYLQWQQAQGWDGIPADSSISWGTSLNDRISSLLLEAPDGSAPVAHGPGASPAPQQRQPQQNQQHNQQQDQGGGALELMRNAMDALLPDETRPRRSAKPAQPQREPTPPPPSQQGQQQFNHMAPPETWLAETQQVVEVSKAAWEQEAPLRLKVLRDIGEQEMLQKQEHLQAVHEHWQHCTRCGRVQTRSNVVPGKGPVHTRLMLIGEGPSLSQDEQGKLWVGKRGPLLTEMLRAIGIDANEVYYTTVVRCFRARPRVPKSEEIEACFPLLQEEMNVVRPDFVVTLGAVATQSLLRVTKRLAHLRGTWHSYHGLLVFPTYSPAYLLGRPQFKKAAWDDWQVIRQQLVDGGCAQS